MRKQRVSKRRRFRRRKSGCFILLLTLLAVGAMGVTLWGQFRPASSPVDHTGTIAQPDSVPSTAQPQSLQTVSQTTVPQETQDPIQVRADELLSSMTLDEKICQLFIVTHDQLVGQYPVTRSGQASREAIEKYPVGGIIYFSPNLESRDQCTSMIRDLQSYSRLGLFIAVDEEGGIVSRLGGKSSMGTTAFPNMSTIGKEEDPAAAYDVGYTIGSDMAALGFNLDFAPVADVNSNPNNPVIGVRAFHTDPQITADMVAACVEGFRDSGTLCTLKHFPGHGDTLTDSHYGEALVDKTLEELMACEILPFRSGIDAGAPFVMVGHITLPKVTEEDLPATLSYEITTDLLRETLHFEGLIITDSMQMQAITDRYDSGAAAVKALQAGVDIILMPQDMIKAVSGIRDAVEEGILTEERIDQSILRILATKLRSGIIPIE